MAKNCPVLPLNDPKIPLKMGIFDKNIKENQYDDFEKIRFFTFYDQNRGANKAKFRENFIKNFIVKTVY